MLALSCAAGLVMGGCEGTSQFTQDKPGVVPGSTGLPTGSGHQAAGEYAAGTRTAGSGVAAGRGSDATGADRSAAVADDNRLACASSRKTAGRLEVVLADVQHGRKKPMQAVRALRRAQKEFAAESHAAKGPIRINLMYVSGDLGQLREGVATQDVSKVAAGAKSLGTHLKTLNGLCRAIGS